MIVSSLRAARRVVVSAVVIAALVVALFTHRAEAAPRKPVTLEIVFHVVDLDGKPVADDAFINARVEKANKVFAPYGVSFVRHGALKLPTQYAFIQDGPSRDALAPEVSRRGRGVIDCFVVRSFKDLGNPQEERRGVHWHAKKPRGCHFVILSTNGGPDVLAHELGHFLGNSQHSETPNNLMSYNRGVDPFLDDKQVHRLESALHGYLARRELRPTKPAETLTAR